MARACLIYFRTLIRRDRETGEPVFHTSFTPSVALRFLEVALRAQGAFALPGRGEDEEPERPAAEGDLYQLADGELEELIALAKGRAQQTEQEEQEHDGNQDSAQQSSGEDIEQEDEAEGKGEQESE